MSILEKRHTGEFSDLDIGVTLRGETGMGFQKSILVTLRKSGLILAHSLRVQPLMVGEVVVARAGDRWPHGIHGLEAREMNAATQLVRSPKFSLGPEPVSSA